MTAAAMPVKLPGVWQPWIIPNAGERPVTVVRMEFSHEAFC